MRQARFYIFYDLHGGFLYYDNACLKKLRFKVGGEGIFCVLTRTPDPLIIFLGPGEHLVFVMHCMHEMAITLLYIFTQR